MEFDNCRQSRFLHTKEAAEKDHLSLFFLCGNHMTGSGQMRWITEHSISLSTLLTTARTQLGHPWTRSHTKQLQHMTFLVIHKLNLHGWMSPFSSQAQIIQLQYIFRSQLTLRGTKQVPWLIYATSKSAFRQVSTLMIGHTNYRWETKQGALPRAFVTPLSRQSQKGAAGCPVSCGGSVLRLLSSPKHTQ